jgi:hypothetical protein
MPNDAPRPADPLCPSADPIAEEAVAFAIVGGTARAPAVSYLSESVPVDEKLLSLAEPVDPREVFRFAAPCATSGCQHFKQGHCALAAKIASLEPRADSARLPACAIRPRCRWWREQGKAACQRCPFIVTHDFTADLALRLAADPTTPEY